MAGDHMTTHRIVSGETPTVGLRVLDYDRKWGHITRVAEADTCGAYCRAWHQVTRDDGSTMIFNCDRLTTKEPR
jgi:hypothetical protein